MKKREQENINEVAVNLYHDAMTEYKSFYPWGWHEEQLAKCNATIIYTDNYIILKSYRTIVAVFDKITGDFSDVLRMVYGYTATSAQHIAKFRNRLPVVKVYQYR